MAARFVLAFALAAAAARAGDRPYDFREKRLANGLRILTLERHSCPIVAVHVWYHVGSKDEAPERQGFAHLFEHMMFRGTDRVGPHGHADLIQSVGGTSNAYTTYDATYFVNELPANQLELALWLEAERMAFLRIDEGNFCIERNVVEGELRQAMNRPYATLHESVMAGIFREHPYRWSTLGCIPHLRAATLEEVEAFWATYYVPSNAVLVIVGDIGHAKAQSLAERCFGWIPGGARPTRTKVAEPPRAERVELRIDEARGAMPIAGVVVPGVPFGHADAVALRMLGWILAGRHRSRLYRDLMWERSIAHNVYPYMQMELEDHGLMGVAAQLEKPGDEDQAMEAIEAQFDRVMGTPVGDEELDGGRRWLFGQDAEARGQVSTLASQIGSAAILADAEEVNLRLERIRKITAADLQRVARTYLGAPKRIRLRVKPGAAPVTAADGPPPASPPDSGGRVARRTGPKAGLERPSAFPASPPIRPPLSTLPVLSQARRRLGSGLEVVVVPDHDTPLASCSLSFRFGAASEEVPGAAYFALSMLTRATARRDATALLEACEREGVEFEGRAEHDGAHISTRCHSGQVESVLELLAEMARFPSMNETGLNLEREMMIRWLDGRRREAGASADAVFCRHLFGIHPYGRPATGETEDMRRLTRQDLIDWWTRFGRPDVAILYVAGDVTPDAVFRSAEERFGDWKAEGPMPEPRVAALPERGKTRIVIVNRPGSVQSEIRVGQVALTRTHPDWAPATLLGMTLGGSPTSRLNAELRKRRGLTYGADGGFVAKRDAGMFWMRASTEISRTGEALRALLEVVARLREEGPTPAEVLAARNCVAGSLAGRWETADSVVGDLWLIDDMGLKPDFFQRYLAAHEAASPEELRRIARAQTDPDAFLIVVVGDASRIHADLEKIAPVTVQ